MALRTLLGNLGTLLANGDQGITSFEDGSAAGNLAALVAAIGVLVADGATPTQAHVTTASAALTAYQASQALGGVSLTFDTTKVTTLTQLRRLVAGLLQQAAGNGMVL